MALTPESLMTAAMQNPILVAATLAAGYIIGRMHQKRKGGMGMGGGGF